MTDKRFRYLPDPEDGELAPADQMFYDDMAWWDYERRRRMTPEELEEEQNSVEQRQANAEGRAPTLSA